MRKIKFRAWDKKNKVMIYDGDFYYPSYFSAELKQVTGEVKVTNYGLYFWIHETKLKSNDGTYFDHTRLMSEDMELMQYIGLKDKNDREIYEGDIVKLGNYGSVSDSLIEVKYVPKEVGYNLWTDLSATWEVIGNIYQNPELLSNTSK